MLDLFLTIGGLLYIVLSIVILLQGIVRFNYALGTERLTDYNKLLGYLAYEKRFNKLAGIYILLSLPQLLNGSWLATLLLIYGWRHSKHTVLPRLYAQLEAVAKEEDLEEWLAGVEAEEEQALEEELQERMRESEWRKNPPQPKDLLAQAIIVVS